ncbi:hypothetical protein chiPu_0028928, partial [Chiloscyllium punctatum]|nr:hypothetical protein [Chiloscyllium punctatum]
MVRGFEDASERQITLDPRIHSRIIGARGRQIRKIMEDFKVVVRMPPLEERQRGSVTVRGTPDAVEEVIDHLLNLQEEYVSTG